MQDMLGCRFINSNLVSNALKNTQRFLIGNNNNNNNLFLII